MLHDDMRHACGADELSLAGIVQIHEVLVGHMARPDESRRGVAIEPRLTPNPAASKLSA
jgi:hypothetical protein